MLKKSNFWVLIYGCLSDNQIITLGCLAHVLVVSGEWKTAFLNADYLNVPYLYALNQSGPNIVHVLFSSLILKYLYLTLTNLLISKYGIADVTYPSLSSYNSLKVDVHVACL